MQSIERCKLAANSDIGTALGEPPRGISVGQMLTHEVGDAVLLERVIEKISGMKIDDYVAKEIAGPLGMKATASHDGRLETTITDLSHLVVALANDGAFENGRLNPHCRLMERSQTTGAATAEFDHGFAECTWLAGLNGMKGGRVAAAGHRAQTKRLCPPAAADGRRHSGARLMMACSTNRCRRAPLRKRDRATRLPLPLQLPDVPSPVTMNPLWPAFFLWRC
jgi:hypothetical protein